VRFQRAGDESAAGRIGLCKRDEYQVFIAPSAIAVENFVRELAKLVELGQTKVG